MTEPNNHLDLLMGYVEKDPDNINLLADSTQAAFDAGAIDIARQLIGRLISLDPGGSTSLPLEAMLAIRESRFDDAAAVYERLMLGEDSPAARFNLSWSLAMIGDKDRAETLLNERTVQSIAAAAMLRLQLTHERGDFEKALEFAQEMMALHSEDAGFAAAVSVLALDTEDLALARQCAHIAGSHPDALATRGMLHMNDGKPEAAFAEFDTAITIRSHHPRAWIGRGLARLARHDALGAAKDLDTGAEQWGDHIGSWIAAGWAYLTAGHHNEARTRFDRALSIDDNFAESHGSLAVLDAMDGDQANARRKISVALRLDRQCFSAALAKSLLMQDNPDKARAIIGKAMNTPINAAGQTLAAYMAAMSPPTLH